jgi:4-aminobutyrate aminotransferase-like enzyme
VHHTGVVPDIVTIGKAVGGGFPLSALATTDAIASAKPWSNSSGSSSSYGGNPLAAAAGAASLRIIEDEGLVDNSRRVGAIMLRELEPWVDRYPFVGTVRGSGMFLAIELVSDKVKKTPLARKVTERIFGECLRRGLLTMSYSASFRIQPPLTTDEATARNGLAIIGEVFDLVDREGWWKA